MPITRFFHRPAPQEVFPAFFRAFLALKATDGELHMHERTTYLLFAINAFQVGLVEGGRGWATSCLGMAATMPITAPSSSSISTEPSTTVTATLRPCKLPKLHAVAGGGGGAQGGPAPRFLAPLARPLPGRLQLELHDHPALLKHWRHAARREARAAAAAGDAHMPV